MKMRFIDKGQLTGLGTAACGLAAAALLAYTFFFAESRWLGVASLILALLFFGIASISNTAESLGLPPPFTNDPLGWRKAKESYKTEDKKESVDE